MSYEDHGAPPGGDIAEGVLWWNGTLPVHCCGISWTTMAPVLTNVTITAVALRVEWQDSSDCTRELQSDFRYQYPAASNMWVGEPILWSHAPSPLRIEKSNISLPLDPGLERNKIELRVGLWRLAETPLGDAFCSTGQGFTVRVDYKYKPFAPTDQLEFGEPPDYGDL